jgi:phosphoribosylformylglycinamidine synthase II
MTEPAEITPELVAEHGLSESEYATLLDIMGRPPSYTELGIFSVMWSEHCSYKSSRKHLKTLPTEAPWVICGPGENAGVIDIGDGQTAIFKIESHNHPSFIEPYQGAATGVGGILRDVFTMGARPIANMNALRFGDPEHPKTRHLVAGVVGGIGGYGNSIGIPTVGGECQFDPAYNGNILVNAMTVGIAPADKIFYSAAAGVGNPVVYVGSKTGRDGIHGATMASAEFDDDSDEKRPTVQVGDPFTEKLLLEACLELMATDAIVAIQDMGAAGLTSSSVEMSSKGGVGIDIDLDKVPCREEAMTAYEIMLSESQERMLMVLKPGREDEARAIFEKWELDFAVIGALTDTGHLVVRKDGAVQADIPVDPLVANSPEYDRPHVKTEPRPKIAAADLPRVDSIDATVLKLLACPDIASKRWIWEQYDHLIGGKTVRRPGGDAAVVALPDQGDGRKALAITTDCTPRYCLADPVEGGKQAVAEAWRNLTAVGAEPLAVTNNLNFGNPERKPIMGQLVGCIEGMGEACRALDFPVISGNVSLYNETNGQAILPTPVIGGVGLILDWHSCPSPGFTEPGRTILLIGEGDDALGASLYLREILGRSDGAPPKVDLAVERRNGDFIFNEIQLGGLSACHDLSDGGLAIAVAEMALANGIGAMIDPPPTGGPHADLGWWFGEAQGRYLIEVADAAPVLERAAAAGVPARIAGTTTGDGALTLSWGNPMSLQDLREAHEGWLPAYMSAAE